MKNGPSLFIAASLTALSTAGGVAWLSTTSGQPIGTVVNQTLRIVAADLGAVVYRNDLNQAKALAEARGQTRKSSNAPVFVPEKQDAPHFLALRNRFNLDSIIAGAVDEYDAQMQLAAWVGTRFEHGEDTVPGGRQVCDPVAVIEAGERGARFWCEIAAYSMIHAAGALGWTARMISASTDGYTWEHAVAEVWSSQFDKWFVVDTDFNVVFEHKGVPLSAWELVHDAPSLKQSGELTIRRFARLKEGLTPQDLLRLYAYAHADFRTDWCTRPLRRASPAGGDLNTRWTSREGLVPQLSAIPRAETRDAFEPRLSTR